jgi:hypothetical protein
MTSASLLKTLFPISLSALLVGACLPPSKPYPHRPPAEIVAAAEAWSDEFTAYVELWAQGLVPSAIPDALIPEGISDSKHFYLKNPDEASAEETWAVRYAKPVNKDSLYAGIPDPKVTYLFLGTALAPFGSKMIIEGSFPHCRFFSIQVTPPLNGREYYAQRQFGTAEVSIADADIEPLPGHENPFRVGGNRNAPLRSYRLEFDLATGDPVALNHGAHEYPYRAQNNIRSAGMLVYQGPLGHETVAGTPLETAGDWNLGAVWFRIYEPDEQAGALGGVPMPKVWFELADGTKYFVGSDFSALQQRADNTIANRVTNPVTTADNVPAVGWFKSWGITRSMLNGVCLANGWSRPDSGARVNQIDLGWTGRGEFEPAPGNIEPHATTNNYASYLGRSLSVPPGYVAVLTGKLPTFPSTRHGEAIMEGGQIRYWSICGIDQDPLSPLPATTIHAVSDDDVVLDSLRNYVIAYTRASERPQNATPANGVTWVDWGTQSSMGLLMRWVCLSPEWNFPFSPHEHNLDWAHSDWAGSQYDSTLIGLNWRNGFMQCYLPRVHLMTKAEFEALGPQLSAEKIPVWVDSSYQPGAAESQLGEITASSLLDNSPASAADNANDGNPATGWSSEFGNPNATITLDLGSPKVISAVKLLWDWIFFGRDYTVEISNDLQDWTVIASAIQEDGQIDLYRHLSVPEARFVRLNLTQYNAGWYRLLEFEVYTNDCDCEAPVNTKISEPERFPWALHVYPNPVSNSPLYYEATTPGAVTLRIFNMEGKCLLDLPRQAAVGKLDLPDLPTGAYLFSVISEKNEQKFKKIVVTSQ